MIESSIIAKRSRVNFAESISAPMIPPTTPHVATAQPSSSLIFPRSKRSGSHTPKKIPTAVKIPCQASVIGPR